MKEIQLDIIEVMEMLEHIETYFKQHNIIRMTQGSLRILYAEHTKLKGEASTV